MRRRYMADPFPSKFTVSQLQNGQGLSLQLEVLPRIVVEARFRYSQRRRDCYAKENAMALRFGPRDVNEFLVLFWMQVDGDTCEENEFRAFADNFSHNVVDGGRKSEEIGVNAEEEENGCCNCETLTLGGKGSATWHLFIAIK
ncbi:hypothetical protein LR48_Vigan04g014400 [Vigna angularis]|uniref:Uncharacterized protein n=1 Tax=Phaseolus angularis TaxID=3914 RepID=A0A0L9UB96_PHAAN|nr:hypothetical protein LR48_Vigan04g014400 [Vigna angularis]